jgi:hypothetical protein
LLDLWIIAKTVPALFIQVSDMFRAKKCRGEAAGAIGAAAGKASGTPGLQPVVR